MNPNVQEARPYIRQQSFVPNLSIFSALTGFEVVPFTHPSPSVSVVMGSSRSDWSGVAFGLPQGSILGLLLFILYTADLSMILSPLGVAAHQYADDTQAYVHGVASEAISPVEKMLLVSDVTG